MNENTPLLNNNSNSNSNNNNNNNGYFDSNTDDDANATNSELLLGQDRRQRGVFMKPKSMSFTTTPHASKKRGRDRKLNRTPSLVAPYRMGSGSIYEERDESWLRDQKEYIERAGAKSSLKKRMKFELDTSEKGRYWELFDAIVTLAFVVSYIWVNFAISLIFPNFLIFS